MTVKDLTTILAQHPPDATVTAITFDSGRIDLVSTDEHNTLRRIAKEIQDQDYVNLPSSKKA